MVEEDDSADDVACFIAQNAAHSDDYGTSSGTTTSWSGPAISGQRVRALHHQRGDKESRKQPV